MKIASVRNLITKSGHERLCQNPLYERFTGYIWGKNANVDHHFVLSVIFLFFSYIQVNDIANELINLSLI